jgi:hypothetical protein
MSLSHFTDAKRQLQKKLQDDELKSTTSAATESGRIAPRQ